MSLREQKGIRATVPPPPPRRETTVHLFFEVLELVVVERLVFRSRAFVGDENAGRFFHPPSRDGIIHFFFLCFKVRERSSPFFEFLSNFSFLSLSSLFVFLFVCKNCGILVVLITSAHHLFLQHATTRTQQQTTTKTLYVEFL